MGRVKTKTVKRAAREMIEKYFLKLTDDFHFNKKIVDACAEVATKRLRNKIAGFTTHLMKRIQKGPVKGISLKIQEEQRERMLDIIPKESRIQIGASFPVDASVSTMFKSSNLNAIVDSKKIVPLSASTD